MWELTAELIDEVLRKAPKAPLQELLDGWAALNSLAVGVFVDDDAFALIGSFAAGCLELHVVAADSMRLLVEWDDEAAEVSRVVANQLHTFTDHLKAIVSLAKDVPNALDDLSESKGRVLAALDASLAEIGEACWIVGDGSALVTGRDWVLLATRGVGWVGTSGASEDERWNGVECYALCCQVLAEHLAAAAAEQVREGVAGELALVSALHRAQKSLHQLIEVILEHLLQAEKCTEPDDAESLKATQSVCERYHQAAREALAECIESLRALQPPPSRIAPAVPGPGIDRDIVEGLVSLSRACREVADAMEAAARGDGRDVAARWTSLAADLGRVATGHEAVTLPDSRLTREHLTALAAEIARPIRIALDKSGDHFSAALGGHSRYRGRRSNSYRQALFAIAGVTHSAFDVLVRVESLAEELGAASGRHNEPDYSEAMAEIHRWRSDIAPHLLGKFGLPQPHSDTSTQASAGKLSRWHARWFGRGPSRNG
jgi:hypothetical protein